jgi:hypothetical protein
MFCLYDNKFYNILTERAYSLQVREIVNKWRGLVVREKNLKYLLMGNSEERYAALAVSAHLQRFGGHIGLKLQIAFKDIPKMDWCCPWSPGTLSAIWPVSHSEQWRMHRRKVSPASATLPFPPGTATSEREQPHLSAARAPPGQVRACGSLLQNRLPHAQGHLQSRLHLRGPRARAPGARARPRPRPAPGVHRRRGGFVRR